MKINENSSVFKILNNFISVNKINIKVSYGMYFIKKAVPIPETAFYLVQSGELIFPSNLHL
jgi:hypothetical protein